MEKQTGFEQTGFEIAINFLLYSYFGITLESEVDEIINASIKKAYSDATNQGAFNTLKKTVKNEELEKDALKAKLGELSAEVIEESSENLQYIKKIIKNINKYNTQKQFDNDHKDICEALCDLYKDIKIKDKDTTAFTYGNAQKWINMTMKYLYVISNIYLSLKQNKVLTKDQTKYIKQYEFAGNFLKIVEYIHIPVDSYILEYLWNNNKNNSSFIEQLPEVKKNTSGYKDYTNEKVKSWSTWDESNYEGFIGALKELEPVTIEKEGPAWIETAIKRKKNSSKK